MPNLHHRLASLVLTRPLVTLGLVTSPFPPKIPLKSSIFPMAIKRKSTTVDVLEPQASNSSTRAESADVVQKKAKTSATTGKPAASESSKGKVRGEVLPRRPERQWTPGQDVAC